MRFILLFLCLTGCSLSPAAKRVKAQNPNCDVTQLEETSTDVKIRISCPGSQPRTKTYRKR